jgi:hypothetical protein
MMMLKEILETLNNGHELTPENLYISGKHRQCKKCLKAYTYKRYNGREYAK